MKARETKIRTARAAGLGDRFSQVFREEHRLIRDALLELIGAFQARDKARVRSLLDEVAVLMGPHFRYTEESLYPMLMEVFGAEHVEKLLKDHDKAIQITKRLVQLGGKDRFSGRDVAEAVRLLRSVLPQVSDCDGLSLMVERLPDAKVQAILDARSHAQRVGLDLLQWAELIRKRPA